MHGSTILRMCTTVPGYSNKGTTEIFEIYASFSKNKWSFETRINQLSIAFLCDHVANIMPRWPHSAAWAVLKNQKWKKATRHAENFFGNLDM
jgi:hypothetical protein